LTSDNNTPQTFPAVAPAPSNEVGLAEIFRIFSRRKWIILGSIVASLVLTWLYTAHLPRIYTSIARVDIGLNEANSIQVGANSQAESVSAQKLETQLGILKSQSLAWDVIKRLHLYTDPDFMGHHPFPASQDPDKIPDGVRVSLTSLFVNSLSVQFERGTEIVQIQYRSTSPALGARIANEIAESYIDRNFQSKYATTLKATTWLNGQLDGLRKSVVEADQKFAKFQQETGLLQTDETHNPNLDKLLQLNVALGNAQAQRILKEELYRASTSVEPDQLLPAGSFPALQSLRTQKATLDGEYASLSAKYGDAYPRVAQIKNQILQVERTIDKEAARAKNQIEVEYQTALSNERSLSSAVDQQKQAIFALNQTALQYTILQRQVLSSRALYEDLVRKLQEAGIASGLNADAISVIDQAMPAIIPSGPRKTLNMEVGFVIGLLIGLGIAVLLETLNSAIQTPEDIATYSGLPTLGFVPHAEGGMKTVQRFGEKKLDPSQRRLAFRITEDVRSKFAEAFRLLRSNLLLSSAGAPPKVILVCSSWPNEGKSTTTSNLAAVLAQMDKRVLLVDADLRRPSLQRYFNVPPTAIGLSEILSGAEYDAADFSYPDPNVPTLQLLTAGKIPPSSSELLMSPQMTKVLEEWRHLYDFVIIDSAPILAVSDALFLASVADGVVIVVRAGSTPRKALRTLKDNIMKVRGRIIGVLLNDVKASSEAYYEYYGGKGGKHDNYYSSESGG
jgi:capsular exopolysaccharide synthesis family protein